jgi:hypothetical protein
LIIHLCDENVTSDDIFGHLDVLLKSLQPSVVYDSWLKIIPDQKAPKCGEIHLLVHLENQRSLPFQGPKADFKL